MDFHPIFKLRRRNEPGEELRSCRILAPQRHEGILPDECRGLKPTCSRRSSRISSRIRWNLFLSQNKIRRLVGNNLGGNRGGAWPQHIEGNFYKSIVSGIDDATLKIVSKARTWLQFYMFRRVSAPWIGYLSNDALQRLRSTLKEERQVHDIEIRGLVWNTQDDCPWCLTR
jgi:hypothetical protein